MRTCMGQGGPYKTSMKKLCTQQHKFQFRNHYHIVLLLFDNIVLSFILSSIMASSSSSKAVAMAAAPMDTSTAVLIRVDQSGRGDYTKIQDAIDAVPSNNHEFVFIWIKPGTYREKVVVPDDKPYITLSGTRASSTIITWNDGDDIYDSPTLSVLATDFVARYLTIENSYGTRGKGVALRVSGDKAAFYSCRFLSYQDTLLDDLGRHFYSNCYIEGATDFIFGNGASLFEKCHIHSVNRAGYAAITAQKRETPWDNTGFIFLGGKITGVGIETAFLGRPWGSHSRVIFAYTFMSTAVTHQGWDNWGDKKKESTVSYGEYKCYGEGANREERVAWAKALSKEDAAPFLSKDMIGGRGWLRPAPTKFKKGFSSSRAMDLND